MIMVGPYDVPHLENFQCSGLGVVPKKGNALRVIMHLLAPFGSSVNDYISKEEFGLNYSTFDNAIAILQRLGPSAAMAKVNIKHVFRLCPVWREDWNLLGLKWNGKLYWTNGFLSVYVQSRSYSIG